MADLWGGGFQSSFTSNLAPPAPTATTAEAPPARSGITGFFESAQEFLRGLGTTAGVAAETVEQGAVAVHRGQRGIQEPDAIYAEEITRRQAEREYVQGTSGKGGLLGSGLFANETPGAGLSPFELVLIAAAGALVFTAVT